MKAQKKIKKLTGLMALSIVIANMIGTGVFTSLGYQVQSISSDFSILLLWILGGIVALSGGLCYSELATAHPRSGGEYHFLSTLYNPLIGFLSGWASIFIGFAAPIAANAIAMGEYTSKLSPAIQPQFIAAGLVVLLSVIHGIDVRKGGNFQSVFTILKILLILFVIFAGFFSASNASVNLLPRENELQTIFSGGFALSLAYVMYAYSGWNASIYIAGEIEQPKKNIPRSIIWGTLIVTGLYLLLNFIFLYVIPREDLLSIDASKIGDDVELAVGYIAGKNILGETGGKILSGLIAFGLISAISSMVIAGPRVMQTMGEDYKLFKIMTRRNSGGAPIYAIGIQMIVALILVIFSSFADLLQLIGFTLSIFSSLVVVGVFISRIKYPDIERPYKVWLYPVTPILFLLVNSWFLVRLSIEATVPALIGMGIISLGATLYLIARSIEKKYSKNSTAFTDET